MKIEPISQLLPVVMVDPGRVTRVWGRAYVAGNINIQV